MNIWASSLFCFLGVQKANFMCLLCLMNPPYWQFINCVCIEHIIFAPPDKGLFMFIIIVMRHL